jgi:uncharacterized membrane protein
MHTNMIISSLGILGVSILLSFLMIRMIINYNNKRYDKFDIYNIIVESTIVQQTGNLIWTP